MTNRKDLFIAGQRVGELTLLARVMPRDKEVIEANTPLSYIRQGKLWRCKCDCGKVCYYSQSMLARDLPPRTCGHGRSEMRKNANNFTEEKKRYKQIKKEIAHTVALMKMAARTDVQKEKEYKTKIMDLLNEKANIERLIRES